MPDVMAAVDWAIAQGYIDENRLGITGGSYGGFMTLWMIGHTDRFKAAVTQRCVSNLHSFYGTSDIGFTFGEYEFGGTAWERQEHFLKYSPISYVANMTTPLLITHSEEDYRCPIEQAEQVFISLKRLGREVEFVRFPNENHNLSRTGKPKHRVTSVTFGWDAARGPISGAALEHVTEPEKFLEGIGYRLTLPDLTPFDVEDWHIENYLIDIGGRRRGDLWLPKGVAWRLGDKQVAEFKNDVVALNWG